MGCEFVLTVLLTENPTLTAKRKKRTMLPVLVVLFLISYGLLAMLVVEQDRTITAQRSLIQQLFSDSMELTALKGKLIGQHGNGKHAPGAQGPSSQAKPQDKVEGKSKVRASKPAPMHPPKDASDTIDVRRSMHTI